MWANRLQHALTSYLLKCIRTNMTMSIHLWIMNIFVTHINLVTLYWCTITTMITLRLTYECIDLVCIPDHWNLAVSKPFGCSPVMTMPAHTVRRIAESSCLCEMDSMTCAYLNSIDRTSNALPILSSITHFGLYIFICIKYGDLFKSHCFFILGVKSKQLFQQFSFNTESPLNLIIDD